MDVADRIKIAVAKEFNLPISSIRMKRMQYEDINEASFHITDDGKQFEVEIKEVF